MLFFCMPSFNGKPETELSIAGLQASYIIQCTVMNITTSGVVQVAIQIELSQGVFSIFQHV